MIRTEEFWEERLDKNLPENWKRAIKRIYGAYPEECLPNGLCDPMYILNVMAFELGLGDGQSNFYKFQKVE
jgi:hypothetical protein